MGSKEMKLRKMFQIDKFQPGEKTGPVECLGRTFESEEARRKYFLEKLREGLYELHEKLAGIPFTTVEEALARLKSFLCLLSRSIWSLVYE